MSLQKNVCRGASLVVLLATYCYGDPAKRMKRAGRLAGVQEEGFCGGARDNVTWRRQEGNVETCLTEKDWIHMAQDKYKWRAVVNTVMNFCVP